METTIDKILISLAQKQLLVEALEAELNQTRAELATTKTALEEALGAKPETGLRVASKTKN